MLFRGYMPKQTYYEILGIERQAPAAEIKSQYRRQAKRYHPDLNPGNPQAAERFRQVQAAYEVLLDPEKRRQYDASLLPHSQNATQSYGSGPRPYRRYDGRSRQRPRASGRPVNRPHQPRSAYSHYDVTLNLSELFRGARRHLTVGQTFTCGRCRGRGKLENGARCERCDGYGFVVSYQRQEILIPPGLQPGMSIHVEVDENQPEHPLLDAPVVSNISVTIKLMASTLFEYRDHQLYTQTQVPGWLLAQGGEWTIPAPEGGDLTFKIPAETLSGSTLTLRKRGLRNGASQRRGNLICTVFAV